MNKIVSTLLLGAFVVMAESSFAASTWYVDAANDGMEGLDGSEGAAYATIQQAIDAPTTLEGDTILVRPGTYDKGGREDQSYPVRVYANKALTIRSTGGREVTEIVGRLSEANGGEPGATAVGCVMFWVQSGEFVLEGFTLRNGSSTNDLQLDAQGGAADNRASANATNIHLVDCTIRDCATWKGSLVRNLQLHRCLILNNTTEDNYGTCNSCGVDNSILCGTRSGRGGGMCRFYNCTVVGNSGKAGYGCDAYNTIYAMNGGDFDSRDAASWVSNLVFRSSISMIDPATAERKFPCADELSLFNVAKTNLFVAPMLLDFRPLASSSANGRGRTSWLSGVNLPAGYTLRDYLGEPLDLSSETCNPGAIQKTVAPQGGCCEFDRVACDSTLIDGVQPSRYSMSYAYAEFWPTQWCMTAASPETATLSCLSYTHLGPNLYRFAGSEGTIWFMPPPPGTNGTVSAQVATDFRYVNPTTGNDEWDGTRASHQDGTKSGPWKTLLHAGTNTTVLSTRTIVYCAEGRYDTGSSGKSRVRIGPSRRLHFVGAGAGKSVIVGAPAPAGEADAYGLGTGAIRCVINDQVHGTGFTGFSFCEGYTEKANNENSGLVAGGYSVGFADCAISNIVSAQCLAYGGRCVFDRCLIVSNNIRGAGFFYGSNVQGAFIGCILRDNLNVSEGYPMIPHGFKVANSTFLRGDVTLHNRVTQYSDTLVFNSLFSDFNLRGSLGVDTVGIMRGCVYDSCNGAKTNLTDCLVGDARYVDKAAGDYRLRTDSPGWDVALVDASGAFAGCAGTDFEGRPVCLDGRVHAAGAITRATRVDGAVDVTDRENRLLVDGATADAYRTMPPGGTLTVSANPASARPVIGVVLNGETNLFAEATGTRTVEASETSGGLVVTPVLGDTWYVNAGSDNAGWADGRDTNAGFGKWAPFRTLAASMAKVAAGDTVIAAPGFYREGRMASGLPCRVNVPVNVALKAAGSPEETFIVGENGTGDVDQWGCSSNDSMRCVHLSAGSRLQGFTLTGGRSKRDNTNGSGNADGSAVGYQWGVSDETRPWVSDCIISNCVGSMLVVAWVNLERCRVFDNVAYNYTLFRGGNLRNVLFARNRVGGTPLNVEADKTYENVTWAADNAALDGSPLAGRFDTPATLTLRSCLFMGMYFAESLKACENCIFTAGNNPMKVPIESISLDDDYRPIIVDGNPVLDAGANDPYEAAPELARDATGLPRIQNGTCDVGALEADWRPRYATDLKGRRLVVAEASPNVVENGSREVTIGDRLVLTFGDTPAGMPVEVAFRVTGNGTLTVSRDGFEDVSYTGAGSYVHTFPAPPSDNRLTLAYAPGPDDSGLAVIERARTLAGTIILVR